MKKPTRSPKSSGPQKNVESTDAGERLLRQLYGTHEGKVSDKWSIYLDEYDRFFSRYRNQPVRMLEIGIQNGGSLEIWSKYFPHAESIIGCDINPACGLLNFDDKRIGVVVGDANADETQRHILEKSEAFDIVIDDGSHKSSDVVQTFSRYFPHLAEGGVFVVEDLHTSYWQDFEGGLYDPLSSMSFFKRLLDLINHQHWGLAHRRTDALVAFANRYGIAFDETSLTSIHSIEFLNSLCVITKRPALENVLGPRFVAGRSAVVAPEIMTVDGAAAIVADEARNPWSPQSMTIEQEIAENRKATSRYAAHLRALADELVEAREKIRNSEAETARAQVEAAGMAEQLQVLAGETARTKAEAARMAEQLQVVAGEAARAKAEAVGIVEQLQALAGETARAKADTASTAEELQALKTQLSAAHVASSILLSDRDHARSEEKRLHDVIDAVYASTSWRVTRLLRGVRRGVASIGDTPGRVRRTVTRGAHKGWHWLPLPTGVKQRVKSAVFSTFPSLFQATNAYRAWRTLQAPGDLGIGPPSWQPPVSGVDYQVAPPATYVPRLEASPLLRKPVRIVAFYLPQFHPIPENDQWWGEGFTEWTNVGPAQPQFVGHHQPHVPDELGYYDLRDVAVQRRQIELAKLYGIEGFCFYFYWFGGKRLLEKPLENWLADRSLDLPFCLCWANENWSRRWDGLDQEILIAQNHSAEDDLAFIAEVAPYLRDPRYIRIDGKPLLLVYRPSLLPASDQTARRWRTWCRENGIGEIFLAYTQSFEAGDPSQYGFDAAVEFPPNRSSPPNVTHAVVPLRKDFSANVYDWSVFPQRSENYQPRHYKLFRSVCPGWDNTARRKHGAGVFINNTPDLYRTWLENAIEDTLSHVSAPSEQLVFVNAWNEWAEGAHLEPDAATGFAYLQATRDAMEAVNRKRKPRIVVVSHDAHPHGAQYLALAMVREFVALGFDVDLIVLGDGPMLPRFAEVATVHRIALDIEPSDRVLAKLQAMRSAGAEVAIANTAVSGLIVPMLKEAGFRTVALVHELPGVLQQYHLEKHAAAINRYADIVVFAAPMVQSGFEQFLGEPLSKAVIRPQGLVRKNPFKHRAEEARRLVCKQHGLAPGTRYVLAVAFVDHRKGPDIFIDMAQEVLRTHPDTAFIWVGHFDDGMEEKIASTLDKRKLTERVKFVGFVQEPMAYYAGASAYALTSREDPFPNVVLESAEVGVPVVAFQGATGAADFVLEHGGLLAENLNSKDFAAKLRDVLNRPVQPSGAGVGSMRQYLLDLLHHATGLQRVSVVVPNYNYAHHLMQRLNSISDQTWPIYELVVLDDASTDGSAGIVDAFLSERPELDGEVIVNEQNSGSVFRQWVKGIARCRGDLVWLAEADDFAAPDFLKELVPAFADPSVVIAYSQSRQVDGAGFTLAEDYTAYTADISNRWSADYVRNGSDEISEAMAVKNTIPNVSAALFRRTALNSVIADLGEELFSYRVAGDWLVYLRVLLQGKIRFSAKRLNSHRRHASSVTRAEMAQRHLDEVRQMQELARSFVGISAETRRKADAWLEHVRSHLGIQGADAA